MKIMQFKIKTKMDPAVARSLKDRGRRWDRQRERCDTCRYWVSGLCTIHNNKTESDGGCPAHLIKTS